jgi:hypothetical protein
MLADSELLSNFEIRLLNVKHQMGDDCWRTIKFNDILQQYYAFEQVGEVRDSFSAMILQEESKSSRLSKTVVGEGVQEKALKVVKQLAVTAVTSGVPEAVKLAAPIVGAGGVNVISAVIFPWIVWADAAAKESTLFALHDIVKGLDPGQLEGVTLKCTCECPDGIIGWVPGGFENYSDKQQAALRSCACYQNALYFAAKKENAILGHVPMVGTAKTAWSALKRMAQFVSGEAGDKEKHCRSLHQGARQTKCKLAMTMIHMISKEKKWYGLPVSDPTTKAEILRSVAIIVAADGWEQIKSCV